MNGILVRVSLAATFLSYAGLILFNETRDILIADISDTTTACVTYNLQLLLNIIYYMACFMAWLLIGWYIIRYPQKFSKIKEILLFIKYLFLSNNWSTRILTFYIVILIVVFWLPALFPFIYISKSWFN